jgi:hypothetical protein
VDQSLAATTLRLLVRHAGHDDNWDILGGPDYEVTYPNGDRAVYVTAVYEARIIKGSPAPGDGELSEIAWFARAVLHATGRL